MEPPAAGHPIIELPCILYQTPRTLFASVSLMALTGGAGKVWLLLTAAVCAVFEFFLDGLFGGVRRCGSVAIWPLRGSEKSVRYLLALLFDGPYGEAKQLLNFAQRPATCGVMRPFSLEAISSWIAAASSLACSCSPPEPRARVATPILTSHFENCDFFHVQSPENERGVHARLWRANWDADGRLPGR